MLWKTSYAYIIDLKIPRIRAGAQGTSLGDGALISAAGAHSQALATGLRETLMTFN